MTEHLGDGAMERGPDSDSDGDIFERPDTGGAASSGAPALPVPPALSGRALPSGIDALFCVRRWRRPRPLPEADPHAVRATEAADAAPEDTRSIAALTRWEYLVSVVLRGANHYQALRKRFGIGGYIHRQLKDGTRLHILPANEIARRGTLWSAIGRYLQGRCKRNGFCLPGDESF